MESLARLILGLLAAALVLATIQGGPDGAKRWLSAKFLGKA